MTEQVEAPFRGVAGGVRADAAPTAEVKALMGELKERFEAFKAEHAEEVAQLRKGMADVVTTEKVDRVNAAITETQEKLDRALAETGARLDQVETAMARPPAAGDGGAGHDVRAEAQAWYAGVKGTESVKVDEADVDAYRALTEAFGTFLRRGDKRHDVHAALSVGSDPDGGYWVPTRMLNRIVRRIFDTSPMRQVAASITITTDSVEFPRDTEDGTTGGWVGETEDRPGTATPDVGMQRIAVHEQYAMPEITQRLLDMASIDVEGWLQGKIADKMARTENDAFVNGDGVSKPRGFLDYASGAVTTGDASRDATTLQYHFTGSSGSFAFDTARGADDGGVLIDVVTALNPAYRPGARWVMNRATEAAVRKLRDGDGRYLATPSGTIAEGSAFQLHGFPITTFEDMPDVGADKYAIAFGNFNTAYLIVDGRGLRILRDPYTKKGRVRYYTTKFTGGDVVNFDAIKLVKFGTS